MQKASGKYFFFHLFLALVLLSFSPKTCLADGNNFFDEHKNSVVIVYAYDRDGNQINQANGFIVRKDGVIVANYHSIGNAAMVKIRAGETLLDIKGLLYADRKNDIALMKTENNTLPALKISDADIGPEGQKVYLIGSPEGEEKAVFDGTLSRIKNISPEQKLLIIAAPDTKNCSGSPVFNGQGEVIGIATFFIKEAQSFYFAMPVSQIKEKLTLKEVTPFDKAELKASEDTAEHWFNLAVAHESLGLFTNASGAYQKALAIDPQNVLAHNNLGIVYAALGIYSFAITEHREAIQLKPDYQEAYVNLGIAYAKSNMPREAIEAFEKAISLKPEDAKAHNNLAVAFFKSDKFKEAIESFRQTVRIKPDYPNAFYNMGSVYYKMDMKKEAIDAFQESVRLNPGLAKAHFELGVIYSADDPKSALEEYEILKSLEPRAAQVLHKIIEMKGTISPEILDSLFDAAEEEMKQTETMEGSPEEATSPDVQSPQKEDLTPQAVSASAQAFISSGSTDSSDKPSDQEPPGESAHILQDMYSVQVGAFNNKTNALSLLKRLKGKGYDAFLKSEYRAGQNIRHLVLVGKFAKKDRALDQAQIMLKKENLKSIIFNH